MPDTVFTDRAAMIVALARAGYVHAVARIDKMPGVWLTVAVAGSFPPQIVGRLWAADEDEGLRLAVCWLAEWDTLAAVPLIGPPALWEGE